MVEYSADGPRPPLGLPPGSVRAILSILIVSQFWLLLCLPPVYERVLIPLNLYFLLAMVMVFFISHGGSIARTPGSSSPLYLPRGTIRLLLTLGTIAVVTIQYRLDPERLWLRLTPSPDQLKYFPQFLLATFCGFLLGVILRKLPTSRSPFMQTLHAWFSIFAALGMLIEVFIQCFVMQNLDKELDLPLWQSILTGVVAFYFSVRS